MNNFVFFGTSAFAVPILKKLIENNYIPKLVITRTDKEIGRKQLLTPTPVKTLARQYRLDVYDADKIDKVLVEKVSALKPEVIIVVAYGRIIPKTILDIPTINAINIHPSLLPRWRGASPVQFAILNGDQKTGTTIMLMDELLDHGPIVAQVEVSVLHDETALELNDRLSHISANLLIETLPKIFNKQISIIEQKHDQATFTTILHKEDGLLDCSKTAMELERQVRAFCVWPGTFIKLTNGQILKIINAIIANKNIIPKIYLGKLFMDKSSTELLLACSDDYLILRTVQLEGKKITSGKEFINGHKTLINVL